MAKVKGPLMSIEARGQIGKSLVFGVWKGVQWVREYVIPSNPQTEQQVNIRTAFSLSVAEFKALSETEQGKWNKAASNIGGQSGLSLFQSRALNAYIDQLGVSSTPASVSVSGDYPDETFTWTAA